MPLDGARAEEKLGADLRIRQPVAGEPGDLLLLRRELIPGVLPAAAHLLPRGEELVPGTFRERLRADGEECLMRHAQLLASVTAAILAPQPFPVEQTRTGEVRKEPVRPRRSIASP